MDTHARQYLSRSIRLTFLLFLLFVPLIVTSWGQERTEPEVSALIKALKDQDARVRAGAAQALAGIGAEAAGAIPSLLR